MVVCAGCDDGGGGGPVADAAPDAAAPDAEAPDARALDATALDATTPDATALDAGAPDAAEPDLGRLPEACADFQACGGDPVGPWAWRAWCQDAEPDWPADCPEAVIVHQLVPEGTVTFAADGTFQMEATYTATARFVAHPRCVGAGACADYRPESDGAWVCADDGAACVCTQHQPQPAVQSGRWRVDGPQLTIETEGMAPQVLWFCAEATRLRLWNVAAEPGAALFELGRP